MLCLIMNKNLTIRDNGNLCFYQCIRSWIFCWYY